MELTRRMTPPPRDLGAAAGERPAVREVTAVPKFACGPCGYVELGSVPLMGIRVATSLGGAPADLAAAARPRCAGSRGGRVGARQRSGCARARGRPARRCGSCPGRSRAPRRSTGRVWWRLVRCGPGTRGGAGRAGRRARAVVARWWWSAPMPGTPPRRIGLGPHGTARSRSRGVLGRWCRGRGQVVSRWVWLPGRGCVPRGAARARWHAPRPGPMRPAVVARAPAPGSPRPRQPLPRALRTVGRDTPAMSARSTSEAVPWEAMSAPVRAAWASRSAARART